MGDRWAIGCGDCVGVMGAMLPDSIDAIVTDPPYGLQFMGREWDKLWRNRTEADVAWRDGRWQAEDGGLAARARALPDLHTDAEIARQMQDWHARWAVEALRVLKPGGFLLAFGGTRTAHRLACALEDAGFEIRDTICWLYGQGFPKSRNLPGGLGTALKPAHEPIIVARKPLSEPTVAANVERWGTGALDIDGGRIGPGHAGAGDGRDGEASAVKRYSDRGATTFAPLPGPRGGDAAGRWPANVALDEEAAAALDEQAGERLASGPHLNRRGASTGTSIGGRGRSGTAAPHEAVTGYGDLGGASRFFYVAKASRAERDAGLDDLADVRVGITNSSGRGYSESDPHAVRIGKNDHPTVKPIALGRWLVRLVCPPGGTVLDPFAGSGSLIAAAVLEGRAAIGIDSEAECVALARSRVAHWAANPPSEAPPARAPKRALKRPAKPEPQARAPGAEWEQTTLPGCSEGERRHVAD
jgi:site-specific DNA-methyltransferase (adenine-specific)